MKFLKWKKILVVLGMVAGVVIISSLTIRWPINTFPAVKGKILDATTGEPIENVVVSVNWIRSSPGPAGEITRTIRSDIAVTDKEGKYHIPRLWSFHLLSVFSRGYMGFMHPLYASKAAVVARERRKIIIGSPALKAYPEEFEYKKDVIHYDIELLSLEEKYSKPEQDFDLSNQIASFENGAYFLILKSKKVFFSVEETFRKWDNLTARFRNRPRYDYLRKRLKRIESSIRGQLNFENREKLK